MAKLHIWKLLNISKPFQGNPTILHIFIIRRGYSTESCRYTTTDYIQTTLILGQNLDVHVHIIQQCLNCRSRIFQITSHFINGHSVKPFWVSSYSVLIIENFELIPHFTFHF